MILKLNYRCRRFKERVLLLYIVIVLFVLVRLSLPVNEDTGLYQPAGVGQLDPPYISNTTSPFTSDVIGNVISSGNTNSTNLKRSNLQDKKCGCNFCGSFEDNLHKLKSLNFNSSAELVRRLGFDQTPADRTTRYPVMVTGANDKFYKVVQGLIKSIHKILLPKYPQLKLIVYDLGFTERQYKMMKRYCRCEVRKLPFDELPKHVGTLSNFAFKPIIINYIFREFGHVWWLDSSVRFISNDLERPMAYLEQHGSLFFTYGPTLNVALHSHKETFKYFDEDPCPYMNYGEIEAGNVAFVNSEVAKVILNRWLSCALDSKCLAPSGSKTLCSRVSKMRLEYIGDCHRYDQSVLSIILRRLYHEQNDYPLVKDPIRIIEVKRGNKVKYFPD